MMEAEAQGAGASPNAAASPEHRVWGCSDPMASGEQVSIDGSDEDISNLDQVARMAKWRSIGCRTGSAVRRGFLVATGWTLMSRVTGKKIVRECVRRWSKMARLGAIIWLM